MITLDLETRSLAKLRDVGTSAYAMHNSTDVICVSFLLPGMDEPVSWFPDWVMDTIEQQRAEQLEEMVEDLLTEKISELLPEELDKRSDQCEGLNREQVKEFTERLEEEMRERLRDIVEAELISQQVPLVPTSLKPLFDALAEGIPVEAHNASFERAIWKHILTPRYDFPEVPVTQWRCSMAKAAALSLPMSLDAVSTALGIDDGKDKTGQKLITRLSKPKASDSSSFNEDEESLLAMIKYCEQDVRVEHQVSGLMDDLSDTELAIFHLDQRINDRGIMVDRELCHKVLEIVGDQESQANKQLAEITDGAVTAVTQRDNIVGYLKANCPQCANIKSLDSDAVEKLLLNPMITGAPKTVLEHRSSFAGISIKKFQSMLNRSEVDSIVRNNLQYHGANTGRWAGRGLQIQNFYRGDYPDVDTLVDVFKSCSAGNAEIIDIFFGENSSAVVAKSLLRPALIARPGYKLMVWDFAQIEARVLAWLANQKSMLDVFHRDGDPYVAQAAVIYNVDEDQVSKDQRQMGKQAVLGLGFQMGAGRFQETIAGYGIIEPFKFCEHVVKTYRLSNKNIVRFWYALQEAAMNAVQKPGLPFHCGKVVYELRGDFLKCRLPSGRELSYFKPKVSFCKEFKRDILTYQKPFGSGLYENNTYGGKLCENITQAVARDCMAEGMLRLDRAGFELIGTVHDEVLTEVPREYEYMTGLGEELTLRLGRALLKQLPHWADGLPLDVDEGFESLRYRKG